MHEVPHAEAHPSASASVPSPPVVPEAPTVVDEFGEVPGLDGTDVVPFLSIESTTLPKDAMVQPPSLSISYAPAGFDPLHAKPRARHALSDGSTVLVFVHDDGASASHHYLAIIKGGKLVRAYDTVFDFAIDAPSGRLALHHVRADAAGTRVEAREIVDVKSGAVTQLPIMDCTEHLRFVDGGKTLLGDGFGHLEMSRLLHPQFCWFDPTGKLVLAIDGGKHYRHAGAGDYVNMASGALEKDAAVVWATREYEGFGNYDFTMIDTRPPHLRKYARLPTPEHERSPEDLELDLAATTLASTTMRYRARNEETTKWGAWQTATLLEAP